jgi:hypothetical protein
LTMECFATVALPLANDPLPFQSRE